MLDLNIEIFSHSADDDLNTFSNAFEVDDIHHEDLSVLLHNDLSNQNTLPLNDDSGSFFHSEIDDQHTIEESRLSIHHESTGLMDHKSDQIPFTGIYNDAEIRHFKDEVSKYQYEVNHLQGELHHHDNMVDLSKGKSDYEFEVSQRNQVTSDLEYAIDKLNDAEERLNNAT